MDARPVPCASAYSNDIRKTITKYGTLGTFDEAQLETWNVDLLEAERDIGDQCAMCSDLRVAEAETNQVIHRSYVDLYDCDTFFPPLCYNIMLYSYDNMILTVTPSVR